MYLSNTMLILFIYGAIEAGDIKLVEMGRARDLEKLSEKC